MNPSTPAYKSEICTAIFQACGTARGPFSSIQLHESDWSSTIHQPPSINPDNIPNSRQLRRRDSWPHLPTVWYDLRFVSQNLKSYHNLIQPYALEQDSPLRLWRRRRKEWPDPKADSLRQATDGGGQELRLWPHATFNDHSSAEQRISNSSDWQIYY